MRTNRNTWKLTEEQKEKFWKPEKTQVTTQRAVSKAQQHRNKYKMRSVFTD